MRPPASTAYLRTLPPWSRRGHVVISIVFLFLMTSCLPTADAKALLRYHHKHPRHHHGHISQPPSALPPDVDGDYPAKPPALLRDRPCPLSHSPSSTAPAFSPVGAPRSPTLANPPSHSHAKPPSIYLTKPPALPPAEQPTLPRVMPPSLSPARSPSPRFTPAKPPTPSTAHSPAKPPRPQHNTIPPAVSNGPPFSPPNAPAFTPAQPPRLPTAKPPAHYPVQSPTPPPHHAIPPSAAKPPPFAPSQTPALSPAQPPRLSPAKPPAHPPAKPPPLSPTQPPGLSLAKPPALPPAAMREAKPPSAFPPAACSNVFDVRSFGASRNGSFADDTRAFRAAWKAACSAESSTLLVPSDGMFTVTTTVFAGPCKPGLTFQIDGVLMPPDGPASWPEADSRRQWITFYKTDGMTLTGRGTIEGNGEEWWNLPCKPHRGPDGSTLPGPCDSPALIRFFTSDNVAVQSLRIENSPQFHLKFDNCSQVRVDGLFISSPASSPNTDGIHVENTKSVQIYNSRINNGDDCVSIGAGCSGVHIENVTCAHGHGISIGSLGVRNTRACVSNVTVRNTRILDSDNGLRIKTWQGGAGSVSAVEFAGVRMENVKNCIVIDQYYCLGTGCANQTSAVRVAGITYRDIRGTYSPQLRGGRPIRFACSDTVACTGITMTDVELRPAGGGGSEVSALAHPYCWNAYGAMATLTVPPVYCLQEGRPESLQDQLDTCSVAELLHMGIP